MTISPDAAATPFDARPGYEPAAGLMHAVADQLIPLFKSKTVGHAFAMHTARRAIDQYNPESGADCVNIARTIAFSMAALALLGLAFDQDLPLQQKMRLFGRASQLNRSADQSERTMIQRRRHQNALASARNLPAEPGPAERAHLVSQVAEAVATYTATAPTAPAPTATAPTATAPTGPAPTAKPPATPSPPETAYPGLLTPQQMASLSLAEQVRRGATVAYPPNPRATQPVNAHR